MSLMSQEKEDSMSYLEMALRAAKEMDELANCPRYDRTTVATKATSATKASFAQEMPEGVRLLEGNPKPAPVVLTHMAVVNDVESFIADTLTQLGKALRSKPEPETSRKLRDLVDALEQCGVVVKISGVGSPSGGKP
jgi:hypothetical protein